MLEKKEHPSTVGRGKNTSLRTVDHSSPMTFEASTLIHGDSLGLYEKWTTPNVIYSDGGYGILGFAGDVSSGIELSDWYEPHIAAWSDAVKTTATIWFWNSEHGWANVHRIFEKYGWRYVSCNIWNKGKAHIAGNVNTKKLKHFPKVTEVCVQYVKVPQFNGSTMQKWLYSEWMRTGLTLKSANQACGVADAAVRKYLDQGHLFYPPPPHRFGQLVDYANEHGDADKRPYFSLNGKKPLTVEEYELYLPYFSCPVGWTNVWNRLPLKGNERITGRNKKVAHLNQKPYDLTKLIIEASTRPTDVVWEPFGGLFTASLVCLDLGRTSFGGEIDKDYYNLGVDRFIENGPLSTAWKNR